VITPTKANMIKKSKKYLIIGFVSFILIWGCEEFFRRVIGGFAGSFPYAESWTIHAPESEVLEVINEMKQENHSLQPPNDTNVIAKRDTSLKEYADRWLYIYFYYEDTKEILYTTISPISPNFTSFALYCIKNTEGIHTIKLINKDYWFIENRLQISKFKKRIIDEITKKIETRKKTNKYFYKK
jgi:hypothetical protein